MIRFVRMGIFHILSGPDHILFLLGLILAGGTVRQLMGVVTAFTLAHSLTLSLTALGVASLSPRLVEPLIAFSIVVVGVENLAATKSGCSVANRAGVWVRFFSRFRFCWRIDGSRTAQGGDRLVTGLIQHRSRNRPSLCSGDGVTHARAHPAARRERPPTGNEVRLRRHFASRYNLVCRPGVGLKVRGLSNEVQDDTARGD